MAVVETVAEIVVSAGVYVTMAVGAVAAAVAGDWAACVSFVWCGFGDGDDDGD